MAPEFLAAVSDLPLEDSCIVVADARLPRHILDRLGDPLLVDAGESLKTLTAVGLLAERVLSRRATRPLTLVAAGGGSVGDAVGFLASILWRGTDFWQVPSTLLAMIDSAHGGKTALNLGAAKNQLGTFHAARRVFIVDELLSAMPVPVRRDGIAEMLKMYWIADPPLMASILPDLVETWAFAPYGDFQRDFGPFVERTIRIKADIVSRDPREEQGIRTVLNLGHTVGHAIELTMNLSHGSAVAWGLAAMLELSPRFGLPDPTLTALRAQLFPLLDPLPALPTRSTLLQALSQDKKHRGETLRSVVLENTGRPLVTDTLSADDWADAFERACARFLSSPVFVRAASPRPISLRMDPSKSELNRALIIAALRPGKTMIAGRSDAEDVRRLASGLTALGYPLEETADGYAVDYASLSDPVRNMPATRQADCGEGGTTFRFLLALACTNRKETRLYASTHLLRRPHEPLLRALRSGGATIAPLEDRFGHGYIVRGWDRMPVAFSVDSSDSSQFASAIALLAAGAEEPFSLRLLGKVTGTSYLDMTLRMLEFAGVSHMRNRDLIILDPTTGVREACMIAVTADESSAAVWHVARFLGHPIAPPGAASALQPDVAVDAFLDAIRTGDGAGEVVIDLGDAPDLLPILAVAALRGRSSVRFTGVARLRHKESDRLEAFARSMREAGMNMTVTGDDLVVCPPAPGRVEGRVLRTDHDHRRAMAGALAALLSDGLTLDDCWCVTKSYPRFWNDARMAGWSLRQNLE